MELQKVKMELPKIIEDDEIAMYRMQHLRQECEDSNHTWEDSVEELAAVAGCSPEMLVTYTKQAWITPVNAYKGLALIMGWEEYCTGRHKSFQTDEMCVNDIHESDNPDMDGKIGENETVEPTTKNVRHRRHDDVKTYVRFEKGRRDALETIAMLEGTTMSDIINKLVSDYIASYTLKIEAVTSLRKKLGSNAV